MSSVIANSAGMHRPCSAAAVTAFAISRIPKFRCVANTTVEFLPQKRRKRFSAKASSQSFISAYDPAAALA